MITFLQTSPTTTGTTADPSESRATQFQPVEGGGETHSGEKLVVAAYAILWALLMGYLVFVWRKQVGVNRRIDELDRVLDRAAAKAKRD